MQCRLDLCPLPHSPSLLPPPPPPPSDDDMQSTFSAVSAGQDSLQFDEEEELEAAATSDGSSEKGMHYCTVEPLIMDTFGTNVLSIVQWLSLLRR